MQSLEMKYVPKDEPVAYQEVQRDTNFTTAFIHRHDCEEINFIPSHSVCQVRCNGSLWKITTPAILIQRAGTYHEVVSVTDEGGPFESRVVYFDPAAISGIGKAHFHQETLFCADCTILPLDDGEAQRFVPWFDLLAREKSGQMPYLLLGILSRMAELVCQGHPVIRGSTPGSYVLGIIPHIRANLEADLSIEALARRFHVSPTKLKADFKAVTGQTVKGFVTQQRLRKACRLLETTQENICAVALACGFSSESHFIDVFRHAFTITPGKYRAKRTAGR